MTSSDRLKTAIAIALRAEQAEQNDAEASLDRIAGAIAAAVVVEIKNLQIVYSAGLVAPPGGGAVTGVFNCTIS
ncbi:MAG: hypothetical protein LBD53_01065 [Tannerella sp.]|jgi:hypothetical protein|nr:hypothetical protein [Tannerella sp.]